MNVLCYQSGCSECAKEERNALMKDLTPKRGTGQQHAQEYGGGARLKNGHLHQTSLATRVDAATKTARIRPYALAGTAFRSNFQKMFSVPPNGT